MRPIVGCTLLLVALSSPACHQMKPIAMDELNGLKPDRAWVTEGDQSVVVMFGPTVVGDTLIGYVEGKYEEMPTAQVKQVRVQRPAPKRTLLVVAAVAVAFGGVAIAFKSGGPSGSVDPTFCEEHPGDPACT